jgi:hypothetical protein
MPRSRFSHDAHRFVACTACHRDAKEFSPRGPNDGAETTDMPMPSIADCRSCHGAAATALTVGNAALSVQPASSRCTDCHAYHRRVEESLFGSLIFDLPSTPPIGNDRSVNPPPPQEDGP